MTDLITAESQVTNEIAGPSPETTQVGEVATTGAEVTQVPVTEDNSANGPVEVSHS